MEPDANQNKKGCCKKKKTDTNSKGSTTNKGFFVVSTTANLLLYLLYLTIVCIITFGFLTTGTYYVNKAIYDLFIDAPFEGYGHAMTTFRESYTINDFWSFAGTAMLTGIFREKWHYEHNPPIKEQITSPKFGQMYDDRLIGRARLRQIRMLNVSCPVSTLFPLLVQTCYPKYDESKEDNKTFHKLYGDDGDGWTYSSAEELQGTPFWGSLDKYSGAGYAILLDTNPNDTKTRIITRLKNNLWISRATRVVFLEFAFFNPNIDVLSAVRLAWEIPATGGVTTSWDIQTIKLVRYGTPYEQFILVCELIFVGFTIFYVIQEFIYLCMVGGRKYFSSIWTYVSIIIHLLSAYCIVYSFYVYFKVNNNVDLAMEESNNFVDFQYVAYWENLYNYCSAILILLAWIKLFKYFSFNPNMSLLCQALARCVTDIGGFGIIFLIVVIAFAQLGHLIFGRQVKGFSTIGQSIFTLFQFILGEFKYREVEDANRLLGPIFFFAYIVFVFMILVNMFLAIINDSYQAVQQDDGEKEEDKIGAKDCVRAMSCRKKRSDKNKLTPAKDVRDICIEPSEIKSYLKKKNFSDVEIQMFFSRFDIYERSTLDSDSGQKLLSDLKNNNYRLSNDTSSSTLNKNVEKDFSFEDSEECKKLASSELQELVSRLGIIESAAVEVIPKISNLLDNFESRFVQERKLSTKPVIPEQPIF